eukprot:COSAG01_NODE_3833_length_5644_cov_7.948838_8_plen_62_part_00
MTLGMEEAAGAAVALRYFCGRTLRVSMNSSMHGRMHACSRQVASAPAPPRTDQTDHSRGRR